MPKFLPWKIIATLALAALPLPVLAVLAGISPAPPLIGFIIGLLACFSADRRWAFGTPLIALAAYALMLLLPLPGALPLYAVALALVALMAWGLRFGAALAFGQAAFGWVYLVLVPGTALDLWTAGALVAGGMIGTSTALWLKMESFRRPPPLTAGAMSLAAQILCFGSGFLFSIWAAGALNLPHGYWIPFVFLQVGLAADPRHPVAAMQRITGAVTGIFLAGLLADQITLSGLRLLAVAACVLFGLRVLPAWPILSRALMTGAIVLLLSRPGDHSTAEHRLLAELLGVGAALLAAGLYVGLGWLGARIRGGRG